MASNWNTTDGFFVEISESRSIEFPDKCLVCGEKVRNGNTVTITGNPVGYYGLWKYQFGFNPKINVPAHVNCGKQLQANIRYRVFLYMVVCAIVLIVGIYFDLERWQMLLSLSVLLLPLIIWHVKNAPFFEFELEDGIFKFHFAEKEYAKEFAAYNKVKILK